MGTGSAPYPRPVTEPLVTPTDGELRFAVAENLYALFRSMERLPGVLVEEDDAGCRHFASPVNPMFKGAWGTRVGDGEADEAVAETTEWFRASGAPFAFWWLEPRVTLPISGNGSSVRAGRLGSSRRREWRRHSTTSATTWWTASPMAIARSASTTRTVSSRSGMSSREGSASRTGPGRRGSTRRSSSGSTRRPGSSTSAASTADPCRRRSSSTAAAWRACSASRRCPTCAARESAPRSRSVPSTPRRSSGIGTASSSRPCGEARVRADRLPRRRDRDQPVPVARVRIATISS